VETLKKVPGWVERLLLPRLNTIDGDLKAMNTRMDGFEKSKESFRNEMKAEFRTADVKIEAVHSEVSQLHESLDIDRRMTIMEAKMKEIERV
jgi:glutaredoxin 2